MIKLKLKDNEYEYTYNDKTRLIARAFVINDNNDIAILHIVGDDDFGHRDYYETSGGGIEENESIQDAIVRELDEEIGYRCEIVNYLGIVEDEYNLLHRNNINHYFLCKTVCQTKIHHVSFGDSLINEICWLNIDEIISKYENMNDTKIARLVKNREYPIALYLKDVLEKM